jgi:hypothetical protein
MYKICMCWRVLISRTRGFNFFFQHKASGWSRATIVGFFPAPFSRNFQIRGRFFRDIPNARPLYPEHDGLTLCLRPQANLLARLTPERTLGYAGGYAVLGLTPERTLGYAGGYAVLGLTPERTLPSRCWHHPAYIHTYIHTLTLMQSR